MSCEDHKGSGPYSATYLNQTPIFEWRVVRCGSKNGHQKTSYAEKRLD
jgi:hypothetical protein